MSLIISDEVFKTTKMTESELKQEIAVMLFQKDKFTLAQASAFSGMNRLRFQHFLASREIPIHYDESDFEEDLEILKMIQE